MSSVTSGRVCLILLSAGKGVTITSTLVMIFAAAVQKRNFVRSMHVPDLLEYHDLETGVHWKMLMKNAGT